MAYIESSPSAYRFMKLIMALAITFTFSFIVPRRMRHVANLLNLYALHTAASEIVEGVTYKIKRGEARVESLK